MDHSKSFETYKIRTFIKRWGRDLIFEKPKLNQFKEPTEESISITLRGFFYSNNEYLIENISEGSTVHSKLNTRIFCEYPDGLKALPGMFVEVQGTPYRVTGVEDIDKLGIAIKISVEEVIT